MRAKFPLFLVFFRGFQVTLVKRVYLVTIKIRKLQIGPLLLEDIL